MTEQPIQHSNNPHTQRSTPVELRRAIKQQAARLGFDLCRVTPVAQAPHIDFFESWLASGRAGEMTYLTRHLEKRRHPGRLAEDGPEFRSMVVLGVNYHQFALPTHLRDDPGRGLIASYAWGNDYHEIVRPLLYRLDEAICALTGRATRGKCLIDTGPVLERDWAQQAGLGFTGKNCCTISPQLGSMLFLAVVLIPETVAYDGPPVWKPPDADKNAYGWTEPTAHEVQAGLPLARHFGRWQFTRDLDDPASPPDKGEASGTTSHTGTCGGCTRCLRHCPTDAFTGPFHLDPVRCISYWTIEARSPIPRELRSRFGNRIFGCDICQEVCPWNRKLAPRTPLLGELHAQSDRIAIPLLEGFHPTTPYWLEPEAFNQRFRRSPIRRAKRGGMLRNVCVALGNWAAPETVEALTRALHDPEPLGRGHAAWALGCVLRKHSTPTARDALETARQTETAAWIREEIHAALGQ